MAAWKGIVGGLALACFAAAGILGAILGKLTALSGGLLLAGLLLALVFIYWNFGGFRAFLAKRQTRYGFGLAILIVITLGIITLVEAISAKYYARWDLSWGKRYSLSKQSKQFLGTINVPVKAIAFYRLDQEGRADLEELFKQYSSYYPKFKFEFVDPDRSPQLAKKYGITTYGTIVVESGDKQEKSDESGEQAITNAILKVSRAGKKVVYFLAGHGEARIGDEGREGLSLAKKAVEGSNYETKELVLLGKGEMPQDAAVLVVDGPKKDPTDQEMQVLTKYIDGGGKALFELEPFTVPRLSAKLRDYGFLLQEDIVVDRLSRLFGGDFFIPVVTSYKDHEITRGFRMATFFPTARSVYTESKMEKGIEAQELALTSPDSWAETDKKLLEQGKARYDEGEDKKGPIPLAGVSRIEPYGKKTKARVAVFGDADFSTNAYLGLSGNSDLFLNSIRWLAEEQELISTRPRQVAFTPVILAGMQGRLAFWVPVVLLPGAIIATGATLLIRRRRRG